MKWAQTGKFAPNVLTSDNLHILLDILARKNIQFPSIFNYGQHQHHEVSFDQGKQKSEEKIPLQTKAWNTDESVPPYKLTSFARNGIGYHK